VESGRHRRSVRDDGLGGLVAGDGAASRPVTERHRSRSTLVVTIALYLALFLLGLAEAMVGAFFYSVGPVPLAAVGFDLAIAGTCLFGGWGMSRPSGGLAPAAGWLIGVFVLASGTPAGSVLITATRAGSWFLVGGAISAAAAVVAAFIVWTRRAGR